MAKERKRDKMLRHLHFRRSTLLSPEPNRTPSPISSSAASSTLAAIQIGHSSDSKIVYPHPLPSEQTMPTSSSTHHMGTNADVPTRSHSVCQPGLTTTAETCNDKVRSEGGQEEQATRTAKKIEVQPLWIQAFNHLSPNEHETLETFLPSPGCNDIMPALESIRAQILQIVDSKRDRAWTMNWRGENIVLRDIAMKIVQWVDKFKLIGDIVLQSDPGHAALPWAAFRFLLQVCMHRQDTVDAILIGLEKSSNIIDRCAVYESLYLQKDVEASRNLQKTILKLYTAILKYLVHAIAVSKDNVLNGVFAVEELSKSLCTVERWERTVEDDSNTARTQYTADEFNKFHTILNELRISSRRFGDRYANINHMLEVSDRSQILEWISTIPYTSHHKRISEERLEGTGEWLLARQEYKDWRASSASNMLLLRGIPGAGKTYMVSKVIDTLADERLEHITTGNMAYFYCNRAEENRRNPECILNTLIQQLIQIDDKQLLKPVVDIYRNREQKGQKSSSLTLQESQELLIKITDIYSQTTICLDALDEVQREIRSHLLKTLRLVIEKSKNLVKIFATSRNDPDILQQFSIFPRIDVQPEDHASDIHKFIKSKIEHAVTDKDLLFGTVDGDFQREICDVLGTRSKGMFQLAALQITFLCQMDTEGDVRASLKDLPDTLTNAYDEIYTLIHSQKGSAPQLAMNAFCWVKFSYEPLASNTLLDAVSAQVNSTGDYSEVGSITTDTILKVCQNLLIWDKRLDIFRFAHVSVEEYLETKFIESECHAYITKISLSLLCSPNHFEKYDHTISTKEGHYKNRHILLYSAAFWSWHFFRYEALQNIDCCVLLRLWERFICQPNYQRWLDYQGTAIQTTRWTSDGFWQKLHAFAIDRNSIGILSSACIFGLRRRFEKSLFCLRPDVMNIYVNKLLSYTSQFGYLELVQPLVEKGAEISAADEDGSTPLHLASMNAHEAMVRLLLHEGADVSAAKKDGSTPLHLASWNKHEAVVQLLLDKGANVSAAKKDGSTPLHIALSCRRKAVVRLLIDNGTDVCAVKNGGSTPLHLGGVHGHEAVTRLLLDKGADVSVARMDGSTPLHIVLSYGREAVVRLVLDKGADVSAARMDGSTPLHLATVHGYVAAARLLLDKGSEVSAARMDGSTPLHLAAIHGQEAMARLLLGRGANISAGKTNGSTPLHHASRYGHEAVALLLLEWGADVAAAKKDGSTPLHIASWNGHQAVARLLLDMGSDISAVKLNGSTPLHLASWNGHKAVAQLLLDNGANISASRRDGSTPLHFASWNRHEAVVQLLQNKVTDVFSGKTGGSLPLHLTSWNGQKGADAAASRKDGSTPLHFTSWNHHEAAAQLVQ